MTNVNQAARTNRSSFLLRCFQTRTKCVYADFCRILDRLQTRCILLPFIATEVTVTAPAATINQSYSMGSPSRTTLVGWINRNRAPRSSRRDSSDDAAECRAVAKQCSLARKHPCCHLIQQRLEQVIVVTINNVTSTGTERRRLAAARPPKPPPTITTRGRLLTVDFSWLLLVAGTHEWSQSQFMLADLTRFEIQGQFASRAFGLSEAWTRFIDVSWKVSPNGSGSSFQTIGRAQHIANHADRIPDFNRQSHDRRGCDKVFQALVERLGHISA